LAANAAWGMIQTVERSKIARYAELRVITPPLGRGRAVSQHAHLPFTSKKRKGSAKRLTSSSGSSGAVVQPRLGAIGSLRANNHLGSGWLHVSGSVRNGVHSWYSPGNCATLAGGWCHAGGDWCLRTNDRCAPAEGAVRNPRPASSRELLSVAFSVRSLCWELPPSPTRRAPHNLKARRTSPIGWNRPAHC